ncbi:MAG: transporter substrate-binding domain-containing protein [Gemmiger sp.]|nr:transporter substrate-binding domain-containing protein [Gemmiger sp.]
MKKPNVRGPQAETAYTPATRRFWRTAGVVLALFMAVLLSPYALAEGDTPAPTVIRVGYINYGGFIEQDKEGNYFGYGVEYLEKIAQYTGWQYEFVFDTWSNHMEGLANGSIDLLCHAQRTPTREDTYLFSNQQIGVEVGALYVPEEKATDYYYDDAATLDGMRVAMMRNSSQNEAFEAYAAQKGFGYQPVYYATVNECFDALHGGHVDGVVMGSLAGQAQEDVCVGCRFSTDPYYFITGPQNAALMAQVDDALAKIHMDDPYFEAKEYEKYYADTAAFSGILYTRQEGAFLGQYQEILVGIAPHALPLSDYTQSGGPHGVFYDTLRAIQAQTGLNLRYVPLAQGQSPTGALAAGAAVAVVDACSENHQEDNLLTSDSFFATSTALVGRHGASYTASEAPGTYTLAIPANNDHLARYIEKYDPEFSVCYLPDTEACLRAVATGKADFMAQNIQMITSLLQDPHYATLSILNTRYREEAYCVVMADTPENRIVLSILNKALRALPEGTVEQIVTDHAVEDAYQLTINATLYKYRGPLHIIALLFVACVALLITMNAQRQKNLDKTLKKNVELSKAVAQAELANRAKSTFLSRMSHDMRTPMNGIIGLTELTLEEPNLPEEVNENLKAIDDSSKYLLSLINDTLDMNKIESGKLTLNPEPVHAKELVKNIIAIITPVAEEKGVKLEVVPINTALGYVKVDRVRTQQIFVNVLSNAIKFTPKGGTVRMEIECLKRENGFAYSRISVADTGIGMSKEFLPHIFDAFSQENTAATGNYTGTGLGLSIVKNLVEVMGGNVQVESELGKGTTITVYLHIELVCGQTAQPGTLPGETLACLEGKRVLLCEDHPLNTQIATRLLKKRGMQVECAANGQQAVALFEAAAPYHYAVVLMDIRMPVMDGLQAARAIRALPRPDARQVPIVAMTANAFDEDAQRSREAGMNAHLTKPIDPQLLYQTIADEIARAEKPAQSPAES